MMIIIGNNEAAWTCACVFMCVRFRVIRTAVKWNLCYRTRPEPTTGPSPSSLQRLVRFTPRPLASVELSEYLWVKATFFNHRNVWFDRSGWMILKRVGLNYYYYLKVYKQRTNNGHVFNILNFCFHFVYTVCEGFENVNFITLWWW